MATTWARGFRRVLVAYSGEASSTADEPSTTPDELPAWWTNLMSTSGYFCRTRLRKVVPSSLILMSAIASNDGFSPASPSAVVCGRGNSSRSSASDPSSW